LQFVIQEAIAAKFNFDAMSAGQTADWFTPLVYWPFCYFLGILGLFTFNVFLLLIAMLSGLMALGILKKSQPADLLR
jgi:hypothetical protein